MGEEGKDKPLTREDVRSLIKEHGGPRGLNLSEKVFEEAIDLSGLDLRGIILKGARFPTHFEGNQLVGAKFDGSDLTEADLRSINFQYAQFKKLGNQPTCLAIADLRGSSLLNANFQGADLTGAKFGNLPEEEGYLIAMPDYTDFRGANLFRANFKGCYFYATKLEGAFIRGCDINDAHLGDADWGNYKIGEEIGEGVKRNLDAAEHRYRHLKMWYNNSGYYDIAAKFYYREKEAHRKFVQSAMGRLLKNREFSKFLNLTFKEEGGWTLLWSWIYRFLCGYGEKTLRIVGWSALAILFLASAYFIIGSVWEWSAFWKSLYFSAVSFTALGYGSWVNKTWIDITNDYIRGLGVCESFLGVFMMSLFLVTFTRKMTR